MLHIVLCVFGYFFLGWLMAIFGARRAWYSPGVGARKGSGKDAEWNNVGPAIVFLFWPLIALYQVVTLPFRATYWLIDRDAKEQATAAFRAAARSAETAAESEAATYRQRSCPHCNKAL